jgi:cyclic pyranopterin phosphate synthase
VTGAADRRVIDYLRISVTDRCNYRCRYCMPPEGVAFRDQRDILSFEEIVAFTRAAVRAGITRVRVTGGEPLVRRGCAGLIARLAGIPGINDISLTTNGALLESHVPELREAGLDRINISLDSLDPHRFGRITGGATLEPVMAGLHAALDTGFSPVKVNAVMLEGIEAELARFVALAADLPVHVRFIEQMPVGRYSRGRPRFVPRRRVQELLGELVDLAPVQAPGGSGPARYFYFDGARGTIGFISAISDHICGECNRLRLTADGRLRNCLFSEEELDIRHLIGGDSEILVRAIGSSMKAKKYDRRLAGAGTRVMSEIGG